MALNANALISVDELESFIPALASESTAYKESLINIASDFIQTYCNRNFISQTYTEEIYDGNGSTILYLNNAPVTTVGSIQHWDTVNNTSDYTFDVNDDYLVYEDEGYIYKRAHWLKGHQNYRITYTAGYADADAIPYNLKAACAKIGGYMKNSFSSAGAVSETMGKYSITYANLGGSTGAAIAGKPVPGEILALLAPYVRYLSYEL